MLSWFIDRQADFAVVDVKADVLIDRTTPVGPSLLANYDTAGELVSVEILSLAALFRPDVLRDLAHLLGDQVRPPTSSLRVSTTSENVTLTNLSPADVHDVLIPIRGASVRELAAL